MKINSPNEAYHFLKNNGLSGLCQESQQLIACMNILSRMCSCDPIESRKAKFNQCTQHYIAFASKAPSFSGALLNKINGERRITFYLNNQLISNIST